MNSIDVRNPELRPSEVKLVDPSAGTPRSVDLRNQVFRVGDWLVDPRANRIERGEQVKTLRNKAMELLVLLANQAGQVVLRDEIVSQVWGGNDYVAAKGITNTIWTLRQSLGDTADTPQYIETIAKRGYRLLAPVTGIPLPVSYVGAPGLTEPAAVASDCVLSVPVNAEPAENDQIASRELPANAESLNTVAIAVPEPDGSQFYLARRWSRRVLTTVLCGAMLAVLLSAFWPLSRQPTGNRWNSAMADIQMLQTTPEVEYPVALAPDGSRYAYASRLYKHQNNSLWLRGLDPAAKPVLLKQYHGYLYALAWAPDGQALAVLAANNTGQCELTVLTLGSLQSRSLGVCADHNGVGVAWSGDGRFIATSAPTATGGIGIVLVDPVTGARTALTTPPIGQLDLVGDFAPNGNALLVQRQISLSELELWQLDLSGRGQLRWQVADRLLGTVLDWYGPEDVLLAVASEGQDPQLHVLNLRDGHLQALGLTGSSPQHLADGGVLFVRSSNRYAITEIDLRQQPLRATSLVRLDGQMAHPAYIDNDNFVFMANLTGHMEIFSGDRQGRSEQLTQLQRMAWDPEVSPDGRWLAFAGQCGGDNNGKICLQDRRSGQLAVLFSGDKSVEAPHWTPDGRQLLFRMADAGRMKIGRISVDMAGVAGSPEWLADLPTLDVQPSADGKMLYWVDKFRPGIWQRDLLTGQDRLRVAEFPAGSRVWTVHGDSLLYLIRQPDRQLAVYRQPAGAASAKLGTLQQLLLDANSSLAVSADGQRLLVPELTTFSYDPALARLSSTAGGGSAPAMLRRQLASR